MDRSEYLARVRQIASDIKAAAKKPPNLRLVGSDGAEQHDAPDNDPSALPVIDQSPRARAIRRIAEIVNMRGWQLEVLRALDRHEAGYVSDLDDDAVFALRDRMEYLEDCAQYACDPEDALLAR